MELRVFYDGDGVDEAIDSAIEDALKPFGLRRWASGYNLIEKTRNLAFSERYKRHEGALSKINLQAG